VSQPDQRKPIACLLHLSDLHLGESFEDAGGPHRKAVRALLDGGSFRMQAHDTRILLMLPLELARVACTVRRRFGQAWGNQIARSHAFDRVVVSGDISTDATDEARFGFAFRYLTAEVPVSTGRMYSAQSLVGLEIDEDILLCVPGNHDKLRERKLTRYASVFSKTPAPLNYVNVLRSHGTTIVFIGLDSNEYGDGTIARGEIDDERFAWLAKTFKQLETDGLTVGPTTITPDEYANAWRVLVLHHHIVSLNAARSITGRVKQLFTAHTTVLKGAEKLIELIRNQIDIVLHGHEHLPVCFSEPAVNAIIVSAGTTSEWSGAPYANSFYVITLYADRTVDIEEHVWTGSGFSNHSRDGSVLLQRFSVPRFDATTARSA
jgi:3',5'-cyclic AMP phosphodiesterase CpdA